VGSFLFLALLISTGCSVYQSDGRKFLEKQVADFSGVSAQQNLFSCEDASTSTTDQWIVWRQESNSELYRNPSDPQLLRVMVMPAHTCDFRFLSDEELNQKIPSAIEITWHNFSPDRFAIPSSSPIK